MDSDPNTKLDCSDYSDEVVAEHNPNWEKVERSLLILKCFANLSSVDLDVIRRKIEEKSGVLEFHADGCWNCKSFDCANAEAGFCRKKNPKNCVVQSSDICDEWERT